MRLISAFGLLVLCSTGAAEAAQTGRWWTEDKRAVMEVTACDEGLCGKLVGFVEPYDDNHQPKIAKNGQPECGLQIMHAHKGDEAGEWDGIITDPRDLTDWKLRMSYRGNGGLHMRGYVLVPLLGKSQDWDVFTGQVNAKCEITTTK